eukprot:CAMPEP_0201951450 /NCGR_PEP_ID=MMETSP0904-20121228/359_1 /ASSEMBLY_ACC=CAM_ASM_000553 /TAXON_ID=420261 /ORGANISM="Thalassiosira antarctica, Strain CCMP982" /LENGTH=297 /DNA_ID=CAMNT_0048494829 /DNA_START=182 /DNA_END=1075 /DNA_ORIENTATION=-
MCNPSPHHGRPSSSSVQEHHTKPIIIGPALGGAAEEQVREAMKLLHSPLDTSPAEASDLEPFACAPKKSCKTRALRSHARFGARFWPLALVLLTFVAQVLFVSSFQLNHPNNQKYMLTKRQEPDIQTLPTTTKAGGSFIDQLTESLSLTPLERIALTCSGNLQMVFSSYYLQPVEVSVDRFELALTDEDGNASKSPLAVYDREVCMDIAGQQFCKATSKVRIYDAELDETLTTQQVGIGQLLRMRNLAPKFRLHDAGRNKHGGMWRFYSMDCKDMIEFDVLEEFSDNAWNIIQTSAN